MNKVNKVLILISIFLLNIFVAKPQFVGSVNLIKNPHFSDSLNHYSSEYPPYKNPVYPEGSYLITEDPKINMIKYFSQRDHTQDEAKLMFFINSGRYEQDTGYVLSQTVRNLNHNNRYTFSFFVAPNSDRNIASLRIILNGNVYEDSLTIRYNGNGVWNEYIYNLDTLHTDTFNFKIYTLSRERFGNDFALDDFSLNKLCDESFEIIDTLRKCTNNPISYKLDSHILKNNYIITWQNSNYLHYDAPAEVIFNNDESQYFYLTINDLEYGCKYYDSIYVENYNEIPVNEVIAENNGLLCPCSSIVLSIPNEYNCVWSTNETSNEITVNKAGKYWVEISSSENCSKRLEIEVKEQNAIIEFSIDSLKAKIGEFITIPINYNFINYDEMINCKNFNLSINLSYNKSIFLAKELNKYRIYQDENIETLNIKLPFLQANNQFLLQGTALFGDVECSDLKILVVDSCSDLNNYSLKNGNLCISDLCKDPTIRLISKQHYVDIKEENNSLIINYKFPESGLNNIEIFNMIGDKIMNIEIINSKEGEKIIKNTNLSKGVYLFKWQNGVNFTIGKFIK